MEWVASRKGLVLPAGVDFSVDCAPYEAGKGYTLESRTYTGQNGVAWGLRLTNPDAEPDVLWASETTVHQNIHGATWVSCSVSVGRISESLTPVIRPPNRPGIVERILSRHAGEGILPLTPMALCCGVDEVTHLLRLLMSEDRHHPVVFVSTTWDGRRFCDVKKLADQLCGLAYVIVGTSAEVSEMLGHSLPTRLNCFDGGVRIYWPGFSQESSPLENPLWIRSRIQALDTSHPLRLSREILTRIAAVSVYTSSPSFISWAKIADWQRANAIEEARQNNEKGKELDLFVAENKEVQAEVRRLTRALEETAQEVAKYKNLAESFRLALQSGNKEEVVASLESGIETVADALAVAAKEFPEQLIFAWNSKSDGDDSVFENPDGVYTVLHLLGTVYFDSHIGKKRCPDFDKVVREAAPGWSHEPHQAKGTMTHHKFWDWYHTKHDGVEYSLPEHFKFGTKKDERHSIRIGFAWDSNLKKFILGYLGQHPETRAS